ncbi:hypothetical protein CRYUN_Cryun33cG0005600 [Craigia yunnanensis]
MFSEGIQVHGFVVKVGLLCDVFVGTCLLHFYGAYKRVFDEKRLFEEMPERNVVSWTSLMFGYLDNGDLENVIYLYWEMRKEDISCKENSFAIVITVCSLLEDELLGLKVLGHVVKSGFENKVSVSNSLVSMFGMHENLVIGNASVTMYAKSGMMVEAKKVFQMMSKRNEVTWNALIGGHAENEEPDDAVKAFELMREEGNYIFDGLPHKNSVSWNAIIAANAHHGLEEEVLKLIVKMRNASIDLRSVQLL